MNIKFINVHIENFLSFKSADIDLTKTGYVNVTGKNLNPEDAASSNGSGKSSLFESIIWCLTGETIRGSKDVVNKYSDGTALVDLIFSVDDHKYRIVRTKDPANLKIYLDDEDISGKGIRDSSKILSDLLPDLNTQLIGSVILLGQGLPMRFTNNSPAGRKEVLEKLSKSDFMITDLKDRLDKRLLFLKQKFRQSEDNLLRLDTEYKSNISLLNKLQNKLDDLLKISIESLELDRNQIQLNIDTLDASLSAAKLDLESSNNLKSDLESKRSFLISDKYTKQDAIRNKYNNELESHKSIYTDLSKQAAILLSEITRLKNITDICPTCGQKLPNVEVIDYSDKEIEYNNLIKQSNDEQNICNDLTLKINDEIKVVEDEHLSQSQDILMELGHLGSTIFNLQKSIDNISKEISSNQKKLSDISNEISNYNLNKDSIEKEICEINEENLKKSTEIAYYNNIKADTQLRIDIINKMISTVSRTFRGYLLSGVIDYISEKTKEYSKCVFGHENIKFELDGNNINISYDDKDYENLSGGERQKIDLIVQLSIRDMLCRYLGFSSNILVVDELFDGLDYYGCQQVINLISTKLSDVEAIYIISHHQDLDIPYDNEIKIIKDANKISRVE